MSMSLRDQLLAAGLVSQKQVRDAERQQQHEQRGQQRGQQKRGQHPGGHQPGAPQQRGPQQPGHKRPPSEQDRNASRSHSAAGGAAAVETGAGSGAAGARHAQSAAAPGTAVPPASARQASAQSAKVARDLELNRKQQEKAQKKARAAQIKQLIDQNRVPRGDTDERYNFVDGGRVRYIAANADMRRRLMAGELVIVRHDGVHEVVPAAIGQRIRERDERALVSAGPAPAASAEPLDDAYKGFEVPDDLIW